MLPMAPESSSHTIPKILLLPGWQNSDPAHWQSRWEAIHGDHRVDQHDWMRPLRGDWSARLEEEVLAAPGPVALVAHSLGCILVAAWAAQISEQGGARAVPRRPGGVSGTGESHEDGSDSFGPAASPGDRAGTVRQTDGL